MVPRAAFRRNRTIAPKRKEGPKRLEIAARPEASPYRDGETQL